MGVRLFAAVLPPRELITQLDALLRQHRGLAQDWRWTKPAGWHLTTAFMPEVTELSRLTAGLADLARSTAIFDIDLGGGIAFPTAQRARHLALGVPKGHDELTQLAVGCRSVALRADVTVATGEFIGHLTLARRNKPKAAQGWLDLFDSLPTWSFAAREVVLVQSHQLGRHYEVLAHFELTG